MIPKIIHQIWEGPPQSELLMKLSESWRLHHPDWHYELWNSERMISFVKDSYPQMEDICFNYKYSIQRWDVIRYLILYKLGGMYVDCDYECFESFNGYITESSKCYFAMEPDEHRLIFKKNIYFSNSLMITPPCHPFFEYLIKNLQTASVIYTDNKLLDVLNSTGPIMLSSLYEKFENKSIIEFLLPELVMPWSRMDVQNYINGTANDEILGHKLEKAISIHYFGGAWLYCE